MIISNNTMYFIFRLLNYIDNFEKSLKLQNNSSDWMNLWYRNLKSSYSKLFICLHRVKEFPSGKWK